MNIPTPEQIDLISKLLIESINELITFDQEIFHDKIKSIRGLSDDAKELNRKLHETTLNHSLAYYLENNIKKTIFDAQYKIDIEYNRYKRSEKRVTKFNGNNEEIIARPDIVIHTRKTDKDESKTLNNLLVIEAKKGKIIPLDIEKIKGFISDKKYFYLFGFTVSYCSDINNVIGRLYYSSTGTTITDIQLNVKI